MLAERFHHVRSGHLNKGVHLPFTAKHELLSFVARELPCWRDHKDRPTNQSEAVLTEHLCDHLNSAAYYSEEWSHVQFRTETADETIPGRKIDLTIKPRGTAIFIDGRRHSQFESLFPIECKRLPTPTKSGRDEREYVITNSGTTGGIQRFKFGMHGAAHKIAAMIGYVQAETLSHWQDQVNGWIKALAAEPESKWNDFDLLSPIEEETQSGTCIYKSCHQRDGTAGQCEIRHLWIKMN